MVYEMQPDDPTWDIMMCFYKGSREMGQSEMLVASRSKIPQAPKVSAKLGASDLFSKFPNLLLEFGISIVSTLIEQIPGFQSMLNNVLMEILPDIPGLKGTLSTSLSQIFDPILMMLERFRPLTAAATPITSSERDLIPKELFLLISAIRLRAQRGGHPLESIIVSLIDDVMNFINNSMGQEVPSIQSPSSSARLTEQDINEQLSLLQAAFPDLRTPSDWILQLGLPRRASDLLTSSLPDTRNTKTWILENLDSTSWNLLCEAISEACEKPVPPTLELVLQEGSAWNHIAKAILGCPNVQISSAKRFLLSSGLGLGSLVNLWSKAQNERRIAVSSQSKENKKSSNRKRSKSNSDSSRNPQPPPPAALEELCPIRTFNGFNTIEGVLEVISATLITHSVISIQSPTQTDVTDTVRGVFDPKTGVLHLADATFSRLPQSLFSIRAGPRELVVSVRTLPSPGRASFSQSVKNLSRAFAESGLIDGSARAQNGPFTWYKLPEWMQVEIVQLFGNSMAHTPWYRFPFCGVFKLYFDVLCKEYKIVSEKFGRGAALFSSGLVTDAVPMVVMGVLFAQMIALAYPVRQVSGDAYNPNALVEQLLVASPRETDWNPMGELLKHEPVEVAPGIWVMLSPTFLGLTEFLVRLANEFPVAVLLQISNQVEVQVRVEVKRTELLNSLESHCPGCRVNFNYKFPTIGTQSNLPQASLAVQVSSLLPTIRYCQENQIRIVQIYDFYG